MLLGAAVMIALVRHRGDDAGLIVVPADAPDAGGLADRRARAVGGDQKIRRNRIAVGELHIDAIRAVLQSSPQRRREARRRLPSPARPAPRPAPDSRSCARTARPARPRRRTSDSVGRIASCKLGIGDHHVEDRLRAVRDLVPDADGLEQPPRRRRDRRGARVARMALAQRRIGDRDLERYRRAPGAARWPAPARQSRRRRSAHRRARRDSVCGLALSFAMAEVYHCTAIKVPAMSAVHDLLTILDLEQLEVNLFRGRSPQTGWQRVFGGQVIGQALVAATPHRRGRAAAFAARLFPAGRRPEGADHLRGRPHPRRQELHHPARRRASSMASAIFSMSVSFHNDEPGLDHQMTMPDVPHPDAAAERRRDQAEDPAGAAGGGAALLRARSGRSNCGRSISAATAASGRRTTASISGCAPPRRCRTIRRSIAARWPMPRT